MNISTNIFEFFYEFKRGRYYEPYPEEYREVVPERKGFEVKGTYSARAGFSGSSMARHPHTP